MSDQTDPLFLAIEGTRPSLPTDAERERSIAAVLDAALPQRARRGWLGWTLREFPPSLLFFGVEDCLFLATLFAGLCLAPAALAAVQNTPLPALLFLVSPALYLALHLLTTWKESMSGMLEWKRTCRVPLQKVTAVRMFVFGGASVVACVAMSAVLWQLSNRALPFAWMLGVSFSSLFLYAALSLAVQRVRRRWALFAVPAAWVVLGARAAALGGCGDAPAARFPPTCSCWWRSVPCCSSWARSGAWQRPVPSKEASMLSVEHVTKRFGTFTALEDVSLTFEPGVYGLVAPNGAGKTTLIKMLATLLFPTEGQILWDGEDIVSLGESYRRAWATCRRSSATIPPTRRASSCATWPPCSASRAPWPIRASTSCWKRWESPRWRTRRCASSRAACCSGWASRRPW